MVVAEVDSPESCATVLQDKGCQKYEYPVAITVACSQLQCRVRCYSGRGSQQLLESIVPTMPR